MLGPAFVASVAYVDPGNFATNIQGGARCGYLLLWVVRAANLMAMVVQYLSAKLGIVTGRTLPELVRDRLPRPATWGMWVQGEVMAMATDVAEFLGAALGLNLLFGVPMLPAGLITGPITVAVLGLRTRGQRRFEVAIMALLGFVTTGVSSSSVGTYAGEVIMAGFVRLRIPLLARRAVTMLPALAILAAGANPTSALVLSQVVLSFGIPFALVPLVVLTSRRDVMGCHVNQCRTTIAGGMCVAVISALNVLLLYQQFHP